MTDQEVNNDGHEAITKAKESRSQERAAEEDK